MNDAIPGRSRIRAAYLVRAPQPDSVDRSQHGAEFTIECAPGEAPKVSIWAANLTIDEESALHDRIVETLGALAIPCMCGLPWSEHAAASPHAATSGECRSFTAASPLREDDDV